MAVKVVHVSDLSDKGLFVMKRGGTYSQR